MKPWDLQPEPHETRSSWKFHDRTYQGSGCPVSELVSVRNAAQAGDSQIRLWYAQSYGLVRFLMRAQWKSSFYHFCKNLRDGLPVHTALYRAYGMPFLRRIQRRSRPGFPAGGQSTALSVSDGFYWDFRLREYAAFREEI